MRVAWLAHLLGLHPWDVERLTYARWVICREWVDEHLKGGGNG